LTESVRRIRFEGVALERGKGNRNEGRAPHRNIGDEKKKKGITKGLSKPSKTEKKD